MAGVRLATLQCKDKLSQILGCYLIESAVIVTKKIREVADSIPYP